MAIGNLGTLITFTVGTDKDNGLNILTFNNMTQKVSGRYSTHNIIGGKPKSEFLGPELRNISFEVLLSAMHGVKPKKTIEKIENAIETGESYTFTVGGSKIGKYKWVITDMSEAWNKIYNKGELVEAKVILSLKEYV